MSKRVTSAVKMCILFPITNAYQNVFFQHFQLSNTLVLFCFHHAILIRLINALVKYMTSKAEELLERLAQIIIVAKCKCSLQRSKSMTHLECLYIDNWIVDELITSVRDNLNVRQMFSSPSTSSVLYTESLDSLK